MKLKHILFLVALTAATSITPLGAAESKAPPAAEGSKPAAKKAAKNTYPLYGKIVEITTGTLTVVRSDAADAAKNQYDLDPKVEFVDGEKVITADNVKPGMWVGGLLKKSGGDGNDKVIKVNIGVKQKGAAKPKGEVKPAKKKAKAKEVGE